MDVYEKIKGDLYDWWYGPAEDDEQQEDQDQEDDKYVPILPHYKKK